MRDIDLLRKIGTLKRDVNDSSKNLSCVICDKYLDSPCNSHTIPRFILKNIADNGYVYTPYSYIAPDMELPIEAKNVLIKTKPGLNEILTFRSICRECDNHLFKPIEQGIETYLNIETLSNEQYHLIALKSLLYEKSRCVKLIWHIIKCVEGLKEELKDGPFLKLYSNMAANQMPEVDKDYGSTSKEISDYMNALSNKTSIKHSIVWDELLNHDVNFACNLMFKPIYSYKGDVEIDAKKENSKFNLMGIFLSVLPLGNGKTRVCMFYRKNIVNMIN